MSGYLFFWLVPVAIIAAAVFGIWAVTEWAERRSVSPYDPLPGCAIFALLIGAAISVGSYVFGAIAWRYLV